MGDAERALAVIEPVIRELPEMIPETPALRRDGARLLRQYGILLSYMDSSPDQPAGRRPGADNIVAVLERALAWSIGDRTAEADVHSSLGITAYYARDLETAHGHYERALRIYEDVVDVAQAMITRNNLAELLLETGRIDEAIDELNEVWDGLRRGSRVNFQIIVATNLVQAHTARADLDLAQGWLVAARKLLTATRSTFYACELDLAECELLIAQGRVDAARTLARRALRPDPTRNLVDLVGERLRVLST